MLWDFPDRSLEQLDLLSFLSNHSYLITVQIVQAEDITALASALVLLIGLIWDAT